MNIRKEVPSDIAKIREVNLEAFETAAEANLVTALRNSGCTYLSLVTEIVGHILFTPVELFWTLYHVTACAPPPQHSVP